MRAHDYEKATEQSLTDLKEAVRLLGEHPTAFAKTSTQAGLMKGMFEAWAWMGWLDLDMLNRQGGPETILLAREIINIGKELT